MGKYNCYVEVNKTSGFSLLEVLIALSLGLILLGSVFSLTSAMEKIHRSFNAQMSLNNKTQFVMDLLDEYAGLAGFNHKYSVGFQGISGEMYQKMLQYTRSNEQQMLSFRMKPPSHVKYSCEGSRIDHLSDVGNVQDYLTLIWVGARNRLLCKTWVKIESEWCELPLVDESRCSQFKNSVEVLVDDVVSLEYSIIKSSISVRIVVRSELEKQEHTYFSSWRLHNQL